VPGRHRCVGGEQGGEAHPGGDPARGPLGVGDIFGDIWAGGSAGPHGARDLQVVGWAGYSPPIPRGWPRPTDHRAHVPAHAVRRRAIRTQGIAGRPPAQGVRPRRRADAATSAVSPRVRRSPLRRRVRWLPEEHSPTPPRGPDRILLRPPGALSRHPPVRAGPRRGVRPLRPRVRGLSEGAGGLPRHNGGSAHI